MGIIGRRRATGRPADRDRSSRVRSGLCCPRLMAGVVVLRGGSLIRPLAADLQSAGLAVAELGLHARSAWRWHALDTFERPAASLLHGVRGGVLDSWILPANSLMPAQPAATSSSGSLRNFRLRERTQYPLRTPGVLIDGSDTCRGGTASRVGFRGRPTGNRQTVRPQNRLCHPVCRRPTGQGARLPQRVQVEHPTAERPGHGGAGLLGSAWVDGGKGCPEPEIPGPGGARSPKALRRSCHTVVRPAGARGRPKVESVAPGRHGRAAQRRLDT